MRAILVCLVVTNLVSTAHAADIPSVLSADGRFTELLVAAKAAGVDGALGGPGPFTLFAPTDAAFAKLPPGRLEALMEPANRTELLKILGLHRVDGRVDAADWRGRTVSTKSASGMPLVIADVDGQATVNGVPVGPAIAADNGMIHVLDAVITLPTPIAGRTGR